jgi:hypothetical protein
MRILCALKDAADRGEVDPNLPLKVAERLWQALWTDDKNTSEESVMQAELNPLLPGGWEKWKYVTYPLISWTNVDRRQFRMLE